MRRTDARIVNNKGAKLRRKLTWTYWIIITMSGLMFLVGLGLISIPLWEPFVPDGPELHVLLAAAGIGIADLVGLYLFNPIARIQKLMGDMSQLTMVLDSFQIRVALRLIETDSKKRATMGTAANHVETAAGSALRQIEQRYEKWLLTELRRGVQQANDGACRQEKGLTTEEEVSPSAASCFY